MTAAVVCCSCDDGVVSGIGAAAARGDGVGGGGEPCGRAEMWRRMRPRRRRPARVGKRGSSHVVVFVL